MAGRKMSKKDIYVIGNKLGLDKNDIDNLLASKYNEQIYFGGGPPYSPGFLYGTISPYDF